jgi:hypothetical protein
VVEAQSAAHQDPLLVPGLTAVRRLREQRRQPGVHARGGARREVGVQTGQVGELLAQGVAVGGPVDRPVEGPVAAVQRRDDPLHGVEVDRAAGVEEPEHELVRAGPAELVRRPDQALRVAGGEAVRQPEHHAQVDVDGGADRGHGGRGRGESVGRHLRDQLQPVRASCLGGDRVLDVEGDHLQDRTLAHGTPFIGFIGRLQV